jgi:hypothetical protein
MQGIFQPVQHNEKWWYVIPMAPSTKPLFHSLLPELEQVVNLHLPMDTDTMLDQRDGNTTHPSTAKGTKSWVVVQLLHNDEAQIETGSLFDAIDDYEVDPDLAADGKPINNTDASVDLCIELGSRDMIHIDEDTTIFLTIDIDTFLVIDY